MLVTLLAPPALAGESSGTRTIAVDDPLVVEILFYDGISISIFYDVSVLSGPPINVLFLDESDYTEYISPEYDEFSYYSAHSHLNTDSAYDSFTWSDEGTYYIVVEHGPNLLDDASLVEFDVTWEEGTSSIYLCGAVLAVTLVVAVIAFAIYKRRPRYVDQQGRPQPTPQAPAPPGAATPRPATAPSTVWEPAGPPPEQPIPVAPVPEAQPQSPPEEPALPAPVYGAPAAYKISRPGPP